MNKRSNFSRWSKCLAALMVGFMIVGVTLVGIALASGEVGTVTIDTFDAGIHQAIANDVVQTGESYKSSTATLGTERDLFVQWMSGDPLKGVNLTVSGGRASFSLDAGVTAWGKIVWDGVDGAEAMQWSGLPAVNLRGSGVSGTPTNDGFQLLVYETDGSFDLGIWVFTQSVANNAFYTLTIPAVRIDPPGKSFFIPFSAFTGDKSIFTNTGLVGFLISPTLPSVDLTMDLFEATSNKDFGDLPDAYHMTMVTDTGASHVVTDSLHLGNTVDTEADGFSSTGANGDDLNHLDDEDGVQPSSLTKWSVLNGGNITVTVAGCTGTCYLNGWIDWNNDGNFTTLGDQVLNGFVVSNGTAVLPLTVPTDVFHSQSVYARFRLCGGTGGNGNDCNSTNGASTSGEVEDYKWGFGPNAVTLNNVEASTANNNTAVLILIGTAMLALGVMGTIALRRKQRTL